MTRTHRRLLTLLSLVLAAQAGMAATPPELISYQGVLRLTTQNVTRAQKAALRGALPRGTAGGISTEKRAALFSALHKGDFGGSCRLLGGCGIAAGRPVKLGRDHAAQDRQRTAGPVPGEAPAPPTGAPMHNMNRVTSIDPSDESAVEPAATPATPVPPSSLATPAVISEAVRPGDVIVMDRQSDGAMRPGSDAYDLGVVGVAAFFNGQVAPGETVPVAIAGIVPCRVDADYGRIEVGDLLVASPTPGHAMRAYDPAPGTLLGKALESAEAGRSTIRILLTPR